MVSQETRAWDNYWKSGEINSCVSVTNQNDQKKVNDFWLRFFDGFGNNAVLLDVGTGNGLLPLMAVATANNRDFSWEIHGIDLSDINPEKYVKNATEQLKQVKFQGRIAAEDLPFESKYFDGITSQYAIEYGDLAKSIPEIARVLKNGGRFCAILHVNESIVVAQNNEIIAEVDFLLGNDIFRASKERLTKYWELKTSDINQNVNGIAEEYMKGLQNLRQGFPSRKPLNTIPQIQQGLFNTLKHCHNYPLDRNLQFIDDAVLSLKKQRTILTDLINSALDKQAIEGLVRNLSDSGFEGIEKDLFYDGDKRNLLGISLKAQKKQ